MPINNIQRKSNFFKTRDKIKAVEIDSQFNNIVDYLNNNIISAINKLIVNQFIGSDNVALRDSFLINLGDNTTKWDFLKLDNFQYYGTSLIKFEQGIPNSILASDNNNNYRFVSPTADGQVLISVLDDLPVFDHVYNDCFTDRCILGNHVALNSIISDNIDGYTCAIADNSIPTIKFADNSVTANTLENGDAIKGIVIDKFTLGIQGIFDTMITSNMIPDNYFNNYFDSIFSVGNAYNLPNVAEYQRITNLNIEVYDPIKFATINNAFIRDYTLGAVALNSIEGKRLQYTPNNTYYLPDINEILVNDCIQPEHLDNDLKTLFGFI